MHYAFYNRLDVHVCASNRTVAHKTLLRIQKGHRYSREKRRERHAFIRKILREHGRAYREMVNVLRGCSARTPPPRKKRE